MSKAKQITAKGQAHDAYRQTQLSFNRILDSNKALREAKVVILAYAESNGRNVQVTQVLGMIEQAIINNSLWMAENQP